MGRKRVTGTGAGAPEDDAGGDALLDADPAGLDALDALLAEAAAEFDRYWEATREERERAAAELDALLAVDTNALDALLAATTADTSLDALLDGAAVDWGEEGATDDGLQ